MKYILLYFILLIGIVFPSFAMDKKLVYHFDLNTNKYIQKIEVYKIKDKYFFNDAFNMLGATYPIKVNKSKYYPYSIDKIGYGFSVVPILKNSFKAYASEVDILNNKKYSGNSILINIRQEDNRFGYVMKYDYNPISKRVELSKIYYLEELMTRDYFLSYSIYIANVKVPDNIKYLEKYDAKNMTTFIVKNFFKFDESLTLINKSIDNKGAYKSQAIMSLCNKKDEVDFSCQLENTKYISLCTNKKNQKYYRYGLSSKIELEHISNKKAPILEKNKKTGKEVYFNKGNFTYILDKYDYTLLVKNKDKKVFSKQCKSISRYLDEIVK